MMEESAAFKENRDWISHSLGFAFVETCLLLAEAFAVITASNFVSFRLFPRPLRSSFGLFCLVSWVYFRVVPHTSSVCSFAPRLPSRSSVLFMAGLVLVAVLCWHADLLSLANLRDGKNVSVARAFQYIVILPIQEELLFRGVVFLGLLRRVGPERARLCAFLSGLSFALFHLPNDNVALSYRLVQVWFSLLGGSCYATRVLRTCSVSEAVWLHAANNALASFVPIATVAHNVFAVWVPLLIVTAMHVALLWV
jgi:membrane protease YdiL (CAAX protease family)